MSADDIMRFLTHFSVSRAIKDSVMDAGPLGRPQRPRPAKRSGECGHGAVQVAVEGVKSCAVAPSKITITWKKWILPGIMMKNLLSMARGFAVHLHSRVLSYVASGSEKRAVLL